MKLAPTTTLLLLGVSLGSLLQAGTAKERNVHLASASIGNLRKTRELWWFQESGNKETTEPPETTDPPEEITDPPEEITDPPEEITDPPEATTAPPMTYPPTTNSPQVTTFPPARTISPAWTIPPARTIPPMEETDAPKEGETTDPPAEETKAPKKQNEDDETDPPEETEAPKNKKDTDEETDAPVVELNEENVGDDKDADEGDKDADKDAGDDKDDGDDTNAGKDSDAGDTDAGGDADAGDSVLEPVGNADFGAGGDDDDDNSFFDSFFFGDGSSSGTTTTTATTTTTTTNTQQDAYRLGTTVPLAEDDTILKPTDGCADAMVLESGDVQVGIVGGNATQAAVSFGECGTSLGGANSTGGAWFVVQGTGGPVLAAASSDDMEDIQLTVFSGGVNCTTDLVCVTGVGTGDDDSNRVVWDSVEGETYYVVAHGGSQSTGGQVHVLLDTEGEPSNGQCESAIELEWGDVIRGSTNFASIPNHPNNHTITKCDHGMMEGPTVWYTVPSDDTVAVVRSATMMQATLNQTSFDFLVTVYSTSVLTGCEELVCVDSIVGDRRDLEATLKWIPVADETYFVAVQGMADSTGFFELSLDMVPSNNSE